MGAANRNIYRRRSKNNSWIVIAVILFVVVLIISFCGFYVESKGWDAVPFADKLTFLPFVTLSGEADKEEDIGEENTIKTDEDNALDKQNAVTDEQEQLEENNGAITGSDEDPAVNDQSELTENQETIEDDPANEVVDLNEEEINDEEINDEDLNEEDLNEEDLNEEDLNEEDLNEEDLNEEGLNEEDLNEEEMQETIEQDPDESQEESLDETIPEPPIIEDPAVQPINLSNGDYILPASNSSYLTADDLSGLTLEQLRIARNEIYARHGRIFTSADLKSYFNSKQWYNETIPGDQFQESLFNEFEKRNIDLISQAEKALQ